MKKILIISFTVLASAVLFHSCIQETFPEGGTATQGQVSESPSALEAILKGIPTAMMAANSLGYYQDGNGWDFSYPAIIISMESMTGDLVITGDTNYDHFSQWGANQALGPTYAAVALSWNNYYKWIKTANDLIALMSDETALTETTKVYKGFAHAYRAMFYLDLVRQYEFKENEYTDGANVIGLGVPIVNENTTEAIGVNNPRATVEDIYNTLIFPDLDKAEAFLADYDAPDAFSVSLALVYGLQARAYLERGSAGVDGAFEKAATYARKAIDESGSIPLTQEQWEDPINGFNSVNGATIWALPLPSENVYNLGNFTAHMSTEEQWTSYGWRVGRGINKVLYDAILDNDFRKHSWLDPDRGFYNYKSCRAEGAEYFANTLKDYANIKFRPRGGNYAEYKTGGSADFISMRVEEMYFIEAEATANISLPQGQALLNNFMKLRITDGSYDCIPLNGTLESFTNELMLQKRIEFWGEGIVMYDLKRLEMSPAPRGYVGTNAPDDYRLNTNGPAPYWSLVIIRQETLNNAAVFDFNNPDPSEKVPLWVDIQ